MERGRIVSGGIQSRINGGAIGNFLQKLDDPLLVRTFQRAAEVEPLHPRELLPGPFFNRRCRRCLVRGCRPIAFRCPAEQPDCLGIIGALGCLQGCRPGTVLDVLPCPIVQQELDHIGLPFPGCCDERGGALRVPFIRVDAAFKQSKNNIFIAMPSGSSEGAEGVLITLKTRVSFLL